MIVKQGICINLKHTMVKDMKIKIMTMRLMIMMMREMMMMLIITILNDKDMFVYILL